MAHYVIEYFSIISYDFLWKKSSKHFIIKMRMRWVHVSIFIYLTDKSSHFVQCGLEKLTIVLL